MPHRSEPTGELRTETSNRWVRGWLGDRAIVDSRESLLFWTPRFPVPFYAFPPHAIASGVLRETSPPSATHPFFGPQTPVLQWFTLASPHADVPQRPVAWRLAALPERVVMSWEPGVLDRWTEEEDEVFVHPRDPYKRVDALPSSRHVKVLLDGEVLAESRFPVLLFETGLPMRSYLPARDVNLDLLSESSTVTRCPYKGETSGYWSFGDHRDIAWSYAEPVPAVAPIAGRIAFYDEFVDVEIDGVRQPRPQTSFSRD